MYNRMLVPVDGSHPAAAALHHALDLAREQGAAVKLITIVDEAIGDYMGGELAWISADALRENLMNGSRTVLEAAAAEAREAGMDVESELIEAPQGQVGRHILRAAEDWQADLLVISSHGRHGLSRLLLGSTTETLVRRGGLPILVVPYEAAD